MCSPGIGLIKCKRKIPVLDRDMHALDFAASGEAGEEFAANLRQRGAGDEGVHHAGAALTFANKTTLPMQVGCATLKRGSSTVQGCMLACDIVPPITTAGAPGRRIGLPA